VTIAREAPVGLTTLAALLELRAAENAGATALLAPGREPLTYADLATHVRDIGSRLRELGIGRGDRVALLVSNGPEAASAFLAIAGVAACAPLNPAYTAAELEFFLRDLDARALVVDERIDSSAAAVAVELAISVFALRPDLAGPAGLFTLDAPASELDARAPEPRQDDVALVLHTSGTTARPKLVPLTHANLCASATGIAASLDLDEDDRCLNVMPLFHIHGLVGALLSSLAGGGSIACAPGFNPLRFFDWISELEPNWYTAVPTMHMSVVERAPTNLRTHLRFVRSSSAPLPRRVAEDLEALFGVPAIEVYGMTEAAHQIAANPLPPGIRKPGSVGLAAGTEVCVLDESGTRLPRGAVGELAVRGPSVFTDGWFRTGDQGYVDDDGYVFLTGRLKELINRGGEKFSPREIEEALLEHPAVAEACAFAVPDLRLGEEVGAAVVLRAPASSVELQQWSAAHLTDFKVPRVLEIVDAIPRGATGKVQRTALAEAFGAAERAQDARFEPPRTARERELAALWADVLELDVDTVGVHDNFFALGGDSLLAAQLMATVEEREGRVGWPALVWAPTVASLAAWLDAGAPDPSSSVVAIQPYGARPPLFVVHGYDGELLNIAALAGPLGLDQPFYGIRASSLDPCAADSIESVAARYVADLLEARPAGPFVLGGLCTGCVVALEMARQLADAGRQPELLVFLDPIGLWHGPHENGRRRRARRLHPGPLLRMLALRFRDGGLHFARARFARALDLARETYVPPVYSGRVAIIDTGDHRAHQLWNDVGDSIEWHHLTLQHRTMLRRGSIEVLGETLRRVLRD
jgi:acyl-CoA synthetase (AMP-forming)/AMP-acid ligase II/aryl carrier-like protein